MGHNCCGCFVKSRCSLSSIDHNVVLSCTESKLLYLRVNSKISFVNNNCPRRENKLENELLLMKTMKSVLPTGKNRSHFESMLTPVTK